MMFEDLSMMTSMDQEDLGFSPLLFADSALGSVDELFEDVNQDLNELNTPVKDDKNNILSEIVMELQIPQEPEMEQEEELKTAGIGVTEDPFFAETSKAANLFQPKKKMEKKSDSTQSLIEEMEEFLNQVEQKQEDKKVEEEKSGAISEEEAQKLLNQLMNGDCMMDDSGFDESNMNSVTHIVNENGENIIILIANDDEDEQNVPGSSGSSAFGSPKPGCTDEESDEDSDWSPLQEESSRRSKRRNAGRNSKYEDQMLKSKQGNKVNKRGRKCLSGQNSFENIKDKKERKKLQNVVAARRYRDKKKNEMTEAEMEEEKLKVKNQSLKSKLSEMEGEMKILKKLALELGLV